MGRIVFETFNDCSPYWLRQLQSDYPSTHNGDVRIRKKRVVIEDIEEPVEVLGARLQDLWDHCSNHHHVDPLRAAANEIGYDLQGSYGNKMQYTGGRWVPKDGRFLLEIGED
jgi:hypothetical protein